ncbi:MAG: ABC transporter substrate-binding protein [Thermoplasmata archaeon]|nr:MAG: ABC transporter substrate-binding protein [Thermoplasmata archaeon]
MKIKINRILLLIIAFILIFAAVGSAVIYRFYLQPEEEEAETLKIGVLLPLSGPEAVNSYEVLDWAAGNINSQGGIKEYQIELVYKDTYNHDLALLADEFIQDESIKIVIGPGTSSGVFDIAPMFIANKKILISAFSTAADVFNAFGGKNYIWRTCQSDVAQIRTILHILDSRNVQKISLMYENSVYGKSFYDWTGFFSLELGIELLNLVEFEYGQSDFSEDVKTALEGDPDYIVCVAFSSDVVEIKKELDLTGSSAKLFLTDAGETPYLISDLGQAAEGLEGTTPSADPAAGFEAVYQTELGNPPNNIAATTYDAFLLALYTHARQLHTGGSEGLDESIKKVVSGNDTKVGWRKEDVGAAVEMILKGELPDISGVSGPLEFDSEFGCDPLETFFNHWQVSGGEFQSQDSISSAASLHAGAVKSGASACRTSGSAEIGKIEDTTGTTNGQLAARKDSWAVIVSTSTDWDNYRHQADALAVYNMLKTNGMSDDKIILLTVDDIPDHERNKKQGDIHHEISGTNLRLDAEIDYSGNDVTSKIFRNVLTGKKTARTPTVLESDENSNVFVYIVDHGGQGTIPFDNGGTLKADTLKNSIVGMDNDNMFRQMFVIIETCFSESMTADIETPEVVFLTSAAEDEPSFAANYDSEIGAWLADDCTYQVVSTLSENKDISIMELYDDTYPKITGSHVRLKNYNSFSNVESTPVSDFIMP